MNPYQGNYGNLNMPLSRAEKFMSWLLPLERASKSRSLSVGIIQRNQLIYSDEINSCTALIRKA